MAGQRRTVMPTVGATGSRGRVTSSTRHTVNEVSNGEKNKALSSESLGPELQQRTWWRSVLDPGRRLLPGESGFTSNQRPVLGYQASLDLIDNPQFGWVPTHSTYSVMSLGYFQVLGAVKTSLPCWVKSCRNMSKRENKSSLHASYRCKIIPLNYH